MIAQKLTAALTRPNTKILQADYDGVKLELSDGTVIEVKFELRYFKPNAAVYVNKRPWHTQHHIDDAMTNFFEKAQRAKYAAQDIEHDNDKAIISSVWKSL